ncbi:malate dehydrogenase (oxaloacetate-decarboxylating) [Lentzea flava]|nr:malate dehydrogenase (oxaloacetate-decarboxylating) [Lentzea flava]
MVGGIGATTAVLRRYAALVEEQAALPTRVIASDYGLHNLPAGIGAVLLVRATPERAQKARDLITDVPVLTDHDTTAIALTAALLTSLGRAGRAPETGRVVIAGANTMPLLNPVLLTAGIRDITTWNPSDALAFPLRRIAADADAVINLVGGGGRFAWPRHAAPAVIVPDPARDPALALPGLLQALTRHPHARLTPDVQHACAVALSAATPPGEQLPRRPDDTLTRQIADFATDALHRGAAR